MDFYHATPIACHPCRRRKIKCSRERPSCASCLSSRQICSYAGYIRKPGPKPGPESHKRTSHTRHRRRMAPDLSSFGQSSGKADTSNQQNGLESGYDQSLSVTQDDLLGHQSSPVGVASEDVVEDGTAPESLQSPDSTAKLPLSDLESISLSYMMHPSHEMPAAEQERDATQDSVSPSNHSSIPVWDLLEISESTYNLLLKEYFRNMCTFSLFHKPTFNAKLAAIGSSSELAALISSMFVFSVRFVRDSRKRGYSTAESSEFPTTEFFHKLALRYTAEAMNEYSEDPPSLCVLQAMILSTFHELSQDVRGIAWRSLGLCVRVAYEAQLHQIDIERIANHRSSTAYNKAQWISDEEYRRAWWAIWELDVFAGTIRRLPTGLDCMQNETFLPISDESWFAGTFEPSCRLDFDPNTRWKVLERSGNRGWKAWYIVLNSMMRDAHLLSYSRGTYGIMACHKQSQTSPSEPDAWTLWRSSDTIWDCLKNLQESLSCFAEALPTRFAYNNEYLSFHSEAALGNHSTLDEDCAKHSIFLMMQLTMFMVHHYEMFWAARGGTPTSIPVVGGSETQSGGGRRTPTNRVNKKAWSQYLDSADNILRIIRNSSPYHVRYVNPLFASTVWLAAVAQIVSKVFDPEPLNIQLRQSKLEVLQHNFDSFVSFWATSIALQQKLDTLESRIQRLQQHRQDRSNGSYSLLPSAGQMMGIGVEGEPQSHGDQDQGSEGQNRNVDPMRAQSTMDVASADIQGTFYSCGPFGLSADMVNSTWPLNLTDMEYNPTDFFNYDVQDFLNYSFDA